MSILPLVSIIIPTYKQASYIHRALESAMAQTYSSKEIIVCDDGSPDTTAAVVNHMAGGSTEVKYLRNETNIGRVANYRQALYQHAKGEWVVVLDGDDYFLDKNFIADAMSAIANSGERNTLFYKAAIVKETNGVIRLPKNPAAEKTSVTSAAAYLRAVSKFGFAHLSVVYNRQKAMTNDFYTAGISSSDLDSFYRLCLAFPDDLVLVSSKVTGVWVKHNENTSSGLSLKQTIETSYDMNRRIAAMPGARQHGIGNWWVVRNSVKPIVYFFLKRFLS